jgi:hypothetical protein
MDNNVLLLLVIAGVLIIAAFAWWYSRRRRSDRLQEHFGSEYDNAVSATGDRRRAEAELADREKRVESFDIKALTPEERARFIDEWSVVQAHFVDDPRGAIGEADDLVKRVMGDRGYPVGNFDQRASDLSVQYPDVVTSYRAGHAIAERAERGDASTEDLRQAMVHYRSLFADLLGEKSTPPLEVGSDRAA